MADDLYELDRTTAHDPGHLYEHSFLLPLFFQALFLIATRVRVRSCDAILNNSRERVWQTASTGRMP